MDSLGADGMDVIHQINDTEEKGEVDTEDISTWVTQIHAGFRVTWPAGELLPAERVCLGDLSVTFNQ